MGLLFEALVVRDLRVYAERMGAGLYHYQDYSNREIDAVVELPTGTGRPLRSSSASVRRMPRLPR